MVLRLSKRLAFLLAAVAGAAALAAGAIVFLAAPAGGVSVTLPAGKSLDVAMIEELTPLPPFELQRDGGPLTAADLRGRWAFVFFGYTNCPDACPATLAILGHVQESLRGQGIEPPGIVFISLDPARDKPQVLRDYVAAFGKDIVGATGSEDALRRLVTFFGVSYERRDGADANSYTFDHTTNFFLVTPDGRWLATFSPADEPEAVLADTLTLMQARL
jgi:protein SCO1